MAQLQGKVAFITGASSGIGAAMARDFARRGANVVLLARRWERLEALALEVRARGRGALTIRCDVTTDGDLEAAVEKTLEKYGRIDWVVANAGFGVAGAVHKLDLDDYRRQFETNIFGVLRTVRATREALIASRGAIAVMGSVMSYVSLAVSSPYSMSKHAVRALAASLRAEMARHGRHVGFGRELLGFDLVAHRLDGFGVRADKDDAGFLQRLRECCVLRQKTVAGMDRVRASFLGGGDDLIHVEIGLGGSGRPDAHGLVGHLHVERVTISVGIDRNGLDPELLRRPDDPASNFSTIGNQKLFEHESPARFYSGFLEASRWRVNQPDRFNRPIPPVLARSFGFDAGETCAAASYSRASCPKMGTTLPRPPGALPPLWRP